MQKLQSEFTQLAEEHARLKTLHEEKANESENCAASVTSTFSVLVISSLQATKRRFRGTQFAAFP